MPAGDARPLCFPAATAVRQDTEPANSMTSRPESDRAITWLLAAYAAYACVFIYNTSFVIGGIRHFSLFDDAMVSMRYAKNFAGGFGLVWNPGGEWVEGYTNPLWVLFMSVLHLLPVARSTVSLLVQESAALLLLVNLIYVARIADLVSGRSRGVTICAVLLTAFYLPLNSWSLQGMEVSLLTLLLTLAIWDVLSSLRAGVFSPRWSLLLGVATLVRMDAAVPLLGLLLFVSITDRVHRKQALRWGLGSLVFFLGVQMVFSVVFYGDLLPNTYYLKMTGFPVVFRLSRGLITLWDFIWKMNVLLFAIPLVFAALRRDRESLLLAWVVIGQLAYSVYVGGDAWEHRGGANRYVSIGMPAFMILFSWALWRLVEWIGATLRQPQRPTVLSTATVLLATLSMVNFNATSGPTSLAEWLLLRPALYANENHLMVRQARLVQETTTPDAKIAVVWAGAVPYFADRYAIDLLGKNDRVIAHQAMHFSDGPGRFSAFYPGHMKWDYAYSIGQLKPDVILQLWGEPEDAAPYLEPYVTARVGIYTWWLRKDSPHIRWDRIEARRTDGDGR